MNIMLLSKMSRCEITHLLSLLTPIFHALSCSSDPLEFQRKILEKLSVGEKTVVPQAMHYLPLVLLMAAARDEAE